MRQSGARHSHRQDRSGRCLCVARKPDRFRQCHRLRDESRIRPTRARDGHDLPQFHDPLSRHHRPALQQAAYLLIIAIETAIAVLCWLGGYRLLRVIRAEGSAFNRAKTMSVSGLALGILLWQLGFVTIAGEWFGMWMSHRWDAVPDAFHFVVILYASLIFLVMRDDDLPPETNSSLP
jgi:predicted small integral membrane protein